MVLLLSALLNDVLVQDLCPLGLPAILAVAHMEVTQRSSIGVFRALNLANGGVSA